MEEKIDTIYFKEMLQQGIEKIFASQRLIANSRIGQSDTTGIRGKRGSMQSRSGMLMEALNNPKYLISNRGDGVHAELTYPLYIRFVDMRHKENWQIYNRQLWGILYRDTFVKMRYGFQQWLQKYLHNNLTEAYKPLQ